MPDMTIQGYRVHYRESGQGRAIVFIHGLAGASSFWSNILERLPDGLRGIAPDLLGFGDSDKPRISYTIPGHAERIREMMTQLNISTFDLVGHSMGGMVAILLTFLCSGNVGKLVLVNTPIHGGRALHGRGRIGATALGIAGVKIGLQIPWVLWLLRRMRRYYFVLDPRFTGDASKATYHSLKSHAEALRGTDLSGRLKHISIPTLIIGTDEDGIVRPDQFTLAAQEIPGARDLWIRDAGHCPTLEKREESREALFRFLQE